jgi:hypothetical protein
VRARRVLRTAVVVSASLVAVTIPAFADEPGNSAYGWVETEQDRATVGAEQTVSLPTAPPTGGGGGGGGPSPCTWTPVEADTVGPTAEQIFTRMPNAEYLWFLRECANPDGSQSATFIPVELGDDEEEPAPDPEELLARAQDELRLPSPAIAMSPPGEQVVHVASWLWLDGDIWRDRTRSASAGGVTASVTAAPIRTLWNMGNGEVVTCNGPGEPYAAGRGNADGSSSCSYTYRNSSAGRPGNTYPVTATIEWDLSWTVTGATGGGPLPGLTTSTSTAVPVGEVQALND